VLIFRQRDLRLVNFLLAVSTLAVGAVLALRGVKEPFDAASDIGTVVSDLGIGYIAAWMFYALTIWRPRDADRRRALPPVARSAANLAGQAGAFVAHVRHSAGLEARSSISRVDLDAALRTLTPQSPTNMVTFNGQPLGLNAAARDALTRVETNMAQVERWAPLVSTELMSEVYEVVDCQFLTIVRQGLLDHLQAPFGALSELVAEWFEKSDRLRDRVASELSIALATAGYNAQAVASDHALEN